MVNTTAGTRGKQPTASSAYGKREHTIVTDWQQEVLWCRSFQLIITVQALDNNVMKGRDV